MPGPACPIPIRSAYRPMRRDIGYVLEKLDWLAGRMDLAQWAALFTWMRAQRLRPRSRRAETAVAPASGIVGSRSSRKRRRPDRPSHPQRLQKWQWNGLRPIFAARHRPRAARLYLD